MTKFGLLVTQHFPSLSNQEKHVASFMLEHEDMLLSSSVAQISSLCNVSQATVVRVCKSLGFSGMKDFKIFYQTGKLPSKQSLNSEITWNDSDSDVFNKIFYKTLSTLENSFQTTSYETLGKIADKIVSVNNIDIFGIGGSAPVAQYCRNEFMRLVKRVNAYTDPYVLHHALPLFSEQDAIIVVSCSGETKEILAIAQQAKRARTTVVSITNHAESTLATLSNYTVVTCENHFFADEMNTFSRIAQISMIDSIYLMVAIRLGKINKEFKDYYNEKTNYKKFVSDTEK